MLRVIIYFIQLLVMVDLVLVTLISRAFGLACRLIFESYLFVGTRWTTILRRSIVFGSSLWNC